jgi:hypothetical protein
MVAAVSTFSLDFFANLAPGVDHGPRIADFINVLAQVFWRRSMIGLLRVPLEVAAASRQGPGSRRRCRCCG